MALAPSIIINLPGYPFENFPSVANIDLLRAIPSAGLVSEDNYVVDGTVTPGDGGGGVYAWNPVSVETDNGLTVIRPSDLSPGQAGRWVQSSASTKALADALASSDPGKGVDLVYGAADNHLSKLQTVNHLQNGELGICNPVGNGWNTYTHFNLLMDDSTERSDVRQFDFVLGGIYSKGTPNTGGGSSTGPGDEGAKVLQYNGVEMRPGCYKAWVQNTLLRLTPGVAPEYANIVELDIDNDSGQSFGTGVGSAGLANPAVWGLTINGANSNVSTITGAMAVISSSSGPLYERGYVVAPGAVKQAAFDDYSSATVSYRDLGSHNLGLDLSGATYTLAAVRLPNNKGIISRNSTNTSDVAVVRVDGSNQVVLGDSVGASNIVMSNNMLPASNNGQQIGSPTQKLSEVHVTRLSAYPPASDAPITNGEMRIQLTSNTSLTFKVKGSDGVVRQASLTLT